MTWNHDMDAAPRDGTRILLYPQWVTARWDFGAENWLVLNIPLNADRTIKDDWSGATMWFEVMADIGGVSPTAWMPLPDPPTGYPDEPLRNDAANLVREAGYVEPQPFHTRKVGDPHA